MTFGLAVFALGSPGQAWAANLPTGANVTHGQVSIQQQGTEALPSPRSGRDPQHVFKPTGLEHAPP